MTLKSPMRYDATLFAQTAAYYTRYRLPYPDAMFDHLQRALAFDGRGMALDLGCGPGRLAIALAGKFEKIIGIDPDEGMLTEARKAAQAAGAANVKFLKGSSWDLSPELGRFRFAIMGQAFHWMDREDVLRRLYGMLETNGAVAIVYQHRKGPAEYQRAEDEVVKQFLGERRRAGEGFYQEPEEGHEAVLERSQFQILKPWTLSYEREKTIEWAVGHAFSTSRASKRQLGDRADAFSAELQRRLLQVFPSGKFVLQVEATALLGRKASFALES